MTLFFPSLARRQHTLFCSVLLYFILCPFVHSFLFFSILDPFVRLFIRSFVQKSHDHNPIYGSVPLQSSPPSTPYCASG